MRSYSFLVLILLITCSSCVYRKDPAPVEYNHKTYQSTDEISQEILTDPVIKPSSGSKDLSEVKSATKIIYHEVQPEETIEDIALSYDVSIMDIAKSNDLRPPYDVKEYQILKIFVSKDYQKTRSLTLTKAEDEPKIASTGKVKFIKPVNGKIISRFGEEAPYGRNKGINIATTKGARVKAVANGKVVYTSFDPIFGNLVIIKLTGSNIVTSYAHLAKSDVSKNTQVRQGETIGIAGTTGKIVMMGNTKTTQIHFAVRENTKAKNPLNYLSY
ncbi:MAG: peptidoglycan DD-metalloendopeptidase family protein [Rickettsiaceae bacterium]|nr:peptidoglycan DD-metalloendopeptidase family protein [Rickettsiaceae bacterium]